MSITSWLRGFDEETDPVKFKLEQATVVDGLFTTLATVDVHASAKCPNSTGSVCRGFAVLDFCTTSSATNPQEIEPMEFGQISKSIVLWVQNTKNEYLYRNTRIFVIHSVI